jgi:hypothetical protein
MKENIRKALDFTEGRSGPVNYPVLGCDIDSQGALHFYSTKCFPGYSGNDGMYEKSVPVSGLSEDQRKALERYLLKGPVFRQTNSSDCDIIYTQDLERDLFGVHDDTVYVFLPSSDAIRKITGDEKFADIIEKHPQDSILVHELGHAKALEMSEYLTRFFGKGKGYIIVKRYFYDNIKKRSRFNNSVYNEVCAKYIEMAYLEKYYPELCEERRKEFMDEIEKDSIYRRTHPEYPQITKDPHGPNIHSAASKLFFAFEKNPKLREAFDFI